MVNRSHRYAKINGLDVHYVEAGQGPLVVLLHGFPHLWFSWRHQIGPIAEAGFRVVAPDMRGMGDTSGPAEPREYGVDRIVGDLVGLLDHLGEEKAVFSGLDFGLFAAYDLAYHHPERIAAIIGLENPFITPSEEPPLTLAARQAGRHFNHIHYFSAPGVADRDLDAAPGEFLRKLFYALSSDYHYLDVWRKPPGTSYIDALPETPPLPWPWLTEAELEFYVAAYSRSGFTGALNWYRAMDLSWEYRKSYAGRKNPVPFYFIGSEQDADLEGWHGRDPLTKLARHHEDVRDVRMIKNAGHMMQMEKPAETTAAMLEFLTTGRESGWA
ncbi:alpha/beta fold hydrolase [Actinomadura livida]|uniref:Alpha/beta hydrolase n=1 Tax=Actinomadura livida TaxID=79909 RepID=A0A7W7IBG6_9ACTN|nr:MULTISPECIES: alpha/beta hydrolase [Actinomadura]MBB4773909.1 pimeloyl-ACP methyl ester carboxylesterase [Actinomadura catellatispora]GGT86216.1 putative epoxide hydrolase EphA [Actinomadura livida]